MKRRARESFGVDDPGVVATSRRKRTDASGDKWVGGRVPRRDEERETGYLERFSS